MSHYLGHFAILIPFKISWFPYMIVIGAVGLFCIWVAEAKGRRERKLMDERNRRLGKSSKQEF